MAGIAARALTGNLGFPVRAFCVKGAEGATGFRDGSPGFIGPGKFGDDAAGRNRYLALMSRVTLGHTKTAGVFGRSRGVRGCLCMRVERHDAERDVHSEEGQRNHTNEPGHRTALQSKGHGTTALFPQRTLIPGMRRSLCPELFRFCPHIVQKPPSV